MSEWLPQSAASSRWRQDTEVAELLEYFEEDRFLEAGKRTDAWKVLSSAEIELVNKELIRCRRDFVYAARNYFWISTKELQDQLFNLWPGQELILDKILEIKSKGLPQKIQIIKARQLGALDPNTPVLKADLSWVGLDSIRVGEEVISTDEYPPGGRGVDRKLRTGTVLKKWEVFKEAYQITLEDGRTLTATSDHMFLCKRRGGDEAIWRTVKKVGTAKTSAPIIPGDQVRVAISKLWTSRYDYEDGWMSGLIDGEGCLRSRNQSGVELCVAQVAGPVLGRAAAYLKANDYPFIVEVDNRKGGETSKLGNKPVYKLVVSQMSEVFRLLGTTLPERFKDKRPWEGKSLPRNTHGTSNGESWLKVLSVEPLGVRRMVDIETSTRTFIANGVVTHNCSTLIEALVAWRTMFFQNVNALVVSYDDIHTGEVLFPIMQFIYDRLPWWLQPAVSARKYNKGIFFENPDVEARGVDPGLNSRIFVKGANAITGVGMGIRLSAVHASEYASWDEDKATKIIDQDIVNALVESPETFAILESTAKGANTYTHRMWKKNIEKAEQAEWYPLFLPWFFESTRVRVMMPGFKLDVTDIRMRDRVRNDWTRCDNDICLQYHARYVKNLDRSGDPCPTCKNGTLQEYTLADDQLAWMQHRRINAEKDDKSKKLLLQEMTSTAEESFQLSGYQMFPDSAIEWANLNVRDPIAVGRFDRNGNFHGMLTSQKPQEDGSRKCPCAGCDADHQYDTLPLKIWKWPEAGKNYCVGADVAEGLGGEASYSVGCCISYNLMGGGDEQVAVWRSNDTDPIEYAAQLSHLGTMYNDALMSVECNRYDICLGTLRTVFNYNNLYRWKHIDSMNILSQKLGWWTNLSSRPRLWQTFRRWLQSHLFYVRSSNLVEEMKNFVKDEEDASSAGGDNKEHDDEVLACLPQDVMVRTAEGLKEIQKVKVGDWVLTHLGRFKPVEAINCRHEPLKIYEISAWGRQPLRLTGNHPVYLWEKYRQYHHEGKQVCWNKFRNPTWLSLDNADGCLTAYGSCGTFPRYLQDKDSVDLAEFAPIGYRVVERDGKICFTSRQDGWPSPNSKWTPRHIPIDKNFLRMIGYYLAEGGKGSHNVIFASHQREQPIRQWLGHYLDGLGFHPSVRFTSDKGCLQTFTSVVMRAYFSTFGVNDNKGLPEWSQLLPPEKQKEIVIGYLLGDGCFRVRGGGIRAATVSHYIALQIVEMSARCGWPTSVQTRDGQNGHRKQWAIEWSSSTAKDIKACIEPELLACKRPFERIRKSRSDKVRLQDGYLVSPIRGVKEIPFSGPVYDIQVADDHSFVADGTVVHNCMIALFTAHEGDWNDALGYIPTRSSAADANTDYEMKCRGCQKTWAAVTPGDFARCPECGSMMLEASRKIDPNVAQPQNPSYDLMNEDYQTELDKLWGVESTQPVYEEI